MERDKVRGLSRDPARGRITLRSWATIWEEHQVARPATLARQRSCLRAHILPDLGHAELVRLTSFEVQRWVTALTQRGLAPATVRRVHQTLSRMMGDAVADDRISANPCRSVRLPAVPVSEARFLDPDELVRLEFAMRQAAPHWADLVPLAADTALRIGELAGLQVRDVDVRHGTVHVRRNAVEVEGRIFLGQPKTLAGTRTVPTLTEQVIELVVRRVDRLGLKPEDWLFAGRDGGLLRANAFRSRVWRPTLHLAGLADPQPTPHSLRHSAVAAWIATGTVDPYHLARWAGHREVSTIYRLYGHLLPTDTTASRAALGELRKAALHRLVTNQAGQEPGLAGALPCADSGMTFA